MHCYHAWICVLANICINRNRCAFPQCLTRKLKDLYCNFNGYKTLQSSKTVKPMGMVSQKEYKMSQNLSPLKILFFVVMQLSQNVILTLYHVVVFKKLN